MKEANLFWMWIGTRNNVPTEAMYDNNVPRSQGIYVSRFNSITGAIDNIQFVDEMEDANYFAVDEKRKLLYVTGRRNQFDSDANLYVYKINTETGHLSLLNYQSTLGKAACHVSLDPLYHYVAVANYITGNYALFRLAEDGRIGEMTDFIQKEGGGPNKKRQDSAKGHAVYFYRRNGITRLFLVDLGSDRIYIMILNEETGKLLPDPNVPELVCPSGGGPRHLTWMENDNRDALIVFVVNELDSTLSVFLLSFDEKRNNEHDGIAKTNELTPTQTIKNYILLGTWDILPWEFRQKVAKSQESPNDPLYGSKVAELELISSSTGEEQTDDMLYISNRGHNSICVFDVHYFRTISNEMTLEQKKTIIPVEYQMIDTYGNFPRYFSSDPTRRFIVVCNKKSGTILTYKRDNNGFLHLTENNPVRIGWPFVLAFCPIQM